MGFSDRQKSVSKASRKSPQELAVAYSKFLKYLENTKTASPHTLRAYTHELQLFDQSLVKVTRKNFTEDPPPTEVDLLKALKRVQMESAQLSARSRQRRMACYKSFFGYLFDQKITSRNLSYQVVGPKTPRTLPDTLSVDEALVVLKELDKEGQENPRLLFLLLYGGGLRISEACDLKWSQVDFHSRTFRILGKGSKERLGVAPPIIFEALQIQKSTLGPLSGESIWGSDGLSTRKAYEWIRQAGRLAGLMKPIHPHMLRHSFATHLLVSGANLRHIQALLGHSSLQATEKYTHLSVNDLARTLERIHPLKSK